MNCKILICAVIFGALAFGGPNSVGYQGAAEAKKEKPRPDAADEHLAKLGKARLEAAGKAYKAWVKPLSATFTDRPYHLSTRWLSAELDLANKKEDRIAAYSAHLHRMKDWEKEFADDAGVPPDRAIALMIVSFQTEAEYWLAKERAGKK